MTAHWNWLLVELEHDSAMASNLEAETAACASSVFGGQPGPTHGTTQRAVEVRVVLICAGVSEALRERIKPTVPDTCGAAIDVPAQWRLQCTPSLVVHDDTMPCVPMPVPTPNSVAAS